jgi:uncharacterized metal-binding protein
MAGAATFTIVLIGVLMIGTYLLQGAILLLQVAIIAAVWALQAAACVIGSLVWCVWWLFDRKAARAALRRLDVATRAP